MEKIYCGSGKIINTRFGDIPQILLFEEDLTKIKNYMEDTKQKSVSIQVKPKRNQEEGKQTHYLEIVQWERKEEKQPEKQNDYSALQKNEPVINKPEPIEDNESDDLPF